MVERVQSLESEFSSDPSSEMHSLGKLGQVSVSGPWFPSQLIKIQQIVY